ncbi:MAG TPA: cytochrome C [Rhodospirillaceae bacterium]|nr:cytochrome C [Rhodospirillaceae bacterium]|tara:strand:- start:1271 stop:1990 length:720 start_codon:yes stop_codon:yes gene_type:complete
MRRNLFSTAGAIIAALFTGFIGTARADGDPDRGRKAFLQCLSCHSARPGLHKTGPSLATVAGQKAATVEGFGRYSDALKASGLVWNDEKLDAWMLDPRGLVPGTSMNIPGIKSTSDRRDIIAFLKAVKAEQSAERSPAPSNESGGSMMMGDRPMPDLEALGPERQVASLTYCRGTYHVRTVAGQVQKIWEFNLRFKSDSSDKGPMAGKPVIIPKGMRGDRFFVIFAQPSEISPFIENRC